MHRVLEIGCGVGRALLEVMRAVKAAKATTTMPLCAVGSTNINYTNFIFKKHKTHFTLTKMRERGLSALVEEGPMPRQGGDALAKRFGTGYPAATEGKAT